jgi:hypothetical protein
MQKKYKGLKDLTARARKADLQKGTFYRLQAEVPSPEKAKELCGTIKSAGGACVVVK